MLDRGTIYFQWIGAARRVDEHRCCLSRQLIALIGRFVAFEVDSSATALAFFGIEYPRSTLLQ